MRFIIVIFFSVPSIVFGQYCTSAAINNYQQEVIFSVTIGNSTISNLSCSGYTDNTNLSLDTFSSGTTIPISISTNRCGGVGGSYVRAIKIFMDWNNDGDFFDVGETVYTSTLFFSWYNTINTSINIPVNVQCSNIRTRIVYSRIYNYNPASIPACGSYLFGETEDYIIPIGPCFEIDAGDDIHICENDTVEMSPEIVNGANYFWTPNSGLSDTNISNPSVFPSSTTTYTLTVDSLGFISTDSVTVYVNPNPIISVSQDQVICNGGLPSDISVTNIQGATYSWSPTNNLTNPIANQTSFTSGLINSTTYSVLVELLGCKSVDSLQIQVNPIPLVSLTANPLTVCDGGNVFLQATSTPSANFFQFQQYNGSAWVNITSPGMGTTNPLLISNLNTTTDFRVRVAENWPGCNISNFDNTTVPVFNILTPPIIHN